MAAPQQKNITDDEEVLFHFHSQPVTKSHMAAEVEKHMPTRKYHPHGKAAPVPALGDEPSPAPPHTASSRPTHNGLQMTSEEVPSTLSSTSAPTSPHETPDQAWHMHMQAALQSDATDAALISTVKERLQSLCQRLYDRPTENTGAFVAYQMIPVLQAVEENDYGGARNYMEGTRVNAKNGCLRLLRLHASSEALTVREQNLEAEWAVKSQQLENEKTQLARERSNLDQKQQKLDQQLLQLERISAAHQFEVRRKRALYPDSSDVAQDEGRARKRRAWNASFGQLQSFFDSGLGGEDANEVPSSQRPHRLDQIIRTSQNDPDNGGVDLQTSSSSSSEQNTIALQTTEARPIIAQDGEQTVLVNEAEYTADDNTPSDPAREEDSSQDVDLQFRCGVYVRTDDKFEVAPLQNIAPQMMPIIASKIANWKDEAAKKDFDPSTLFEKQSSAMKSKQCLFRKISNAKSDYYISENVKDVKEFTCKYCTRHGFPCMQNENGVTDYDLILTMLAPEFREGGEPDRCSTYLSSATSDWVESHKKQLYELFGHKGKDTRRAAQSTASSKRSSNRNRTDEDSTAE